MIEEKKGAARLDRSSTDAMHWAECFCEQMNKTKEPWSADDLMGWFANYWAAVHDPLANRIEHLENEEFSKILKEIYSREVNFSLTTFWDNGYEAKLGDEMNGFVAEDNFDTLEEAIEFLRDQLDIHFPINP